MLKLVGIFALVSVAYAAVQRFPAEPKPAEFADQEGCYLDSLKMVLPYDETYYPPNQCLSYICQKSNNETQQFSCGAVAAQGECRVSEEDLTKKYPDCCKTIVCDTTTAAPTTTPASTTPASTTPASTTPASTTPASTTPASTTPASTTPVSSTQPPSNQGSYAYASAQSGGGQPPKTEQYTSGPNASASANAS